MRRWISLLALAEALLLAAGGAPQAGEQDGLALARTLGVDGASGGRITAQWDAVEGEQTGACVRYASAEGFLSARQALPWDGGREIALTSLSYIIIGNEADPGAVLLQVLEDREISPAAAVWAAEDASALFAGDESVAGRLDVLLAAGQGAPTAGQVLARLWEEGCAWVPRLVLRGGRLCVDGETQWRAAP